MTLIAFILLPDLSCCATGSSNAYGDVALISIEVSQPDHVSPRGFATYARMEMSIGWMWSLRRDRIWTRPAVI